MPRDPLNLLVYVIVLIIIIVVLFKVLALL
jgi:hypothetical protein